MSDEPNEISDCQPPQESDAAARFVDLLTSHQRSLQVYISTLLLGDHAAADVLQDTNIDLWKKFVDYDFDRPFLPWAFAFARQRVLAHRKTQSRSRLLFSDKAMASVESECAKLAGDVDARMHALESCLKKLDPNQAQLIRERYFARTSVRLIAARLGETPHNISSRLYRVRRELAKCINSTLARGTR